MSETSPVALVFEDLPLGRHGAARFHRAPRRVVTSAADLRARAVSTRAPRATRRLRCRWPGLHALCSGRCPTTMNQLDGLVPGLPDDVRSRFAVAPTAFRSMRSKRCVCSSTAERSSATARSFAWWGASTTSTYRRRYALIAARLDGLPSDERRVIEHAAVLGKTFPARGVAASARRARCGRARVGGLVRGSSSSMRIHAPPSAGSTASSRRSSRVAYETQSKKERAASSPRGRAPRERPPASTLTRSPRSSRRTIGMRCSSTRPARAQLGPAHRHAAGSRGQENAPPPGAPEDAARLSTTLRLADQGLSNGRLSSSAGELFLADG